MTHNQESLRILRRAGELPDSALNLGETALALAAFERPDVKMEVYRQHLALLVEQVKACGASLRVEDQLNALRRVMVVQNKYQGDDTHREEKGASNLMDVIDRRCGSPMMLGVLYLHVAHCLGWAMTGIDLSGHFLLRLSAADGQVVFDPFRSGQTCQIEEAAGELLDEDVDGFDRLTQTKPLDLGSELLHPLSSRELLLEIQHGVKNRLLAASELDAAIAVLQGMILFAPRQQVLWKELGCLQAERGHIRAAITALEVVKDLAADPIPLKQADVILRELRWRLN